MPVTLEYNITNISMLLELRMITNVAIVIVCLSIVLENKALTGICDTH